MIKEAFNKEEHIPRTFGIITKEELVNCFVWSKALSGSETWTLRRSEEKRIEAVEMWTWGRKERVKWTDRIRNEVVFERVGEERMMLKLIRKRKRNWLCHWLRKNCLLKDALEGIVNGRGLRGRRKYQMIDDIKIYGSYGPTEKKRKAENRKDWIKYWVCSERPALGQSTCASQMGAGYKQRVATDLFTLNVDMIAIPRRLSTTKMYVPSFQDIWRGETLIVNRIAGGGYTFAAAASDVEGTLDWWLAQWKRLNNKYQFYNKKHKATEQLDVNSQFQNLIFATGGSKNKLFKKQIHQGKHFVGQNVENSLILKTMPKLNSLSRSICVMEYGGMAKCLICGKLFQHVKKFNIQRHYSVCHTNGYDKYGGEDRQVLVQQSKDKLLSEAREHTVSESMVSNQIPYHHYSLDLEPRVKNEMFFNELVPEVPLKEWVQCFNDLFHRMGNSLEEVPGLRGKAVTGKCKRVIENNPASKKSSKFLTFTVENVKQSLKYGTFLLTSSYALVTPCDVDRSFSAIKLIPTDKRGRFTVENLKKLLVLYCHLT
ncbi:hypothetical protein ANN_17570 [Periplaneta americana]|uniref:C2H2-type domain-containing protein n=1 Tax=Periplaneta americana TaxID=6978 RepID=A0ABQ8STB2_PERAM|nr:hypothetical protein ANN_17570 [Periplaneta americana]